MHVRNVWTRKQGKKSHKIGSYHVLTTFFHLSFFVQRAGCTFFELIVLHQQPFFSVFIVSQSCLSVECNFLRACMGSLSRSLCIFLFWPHFGFCHLLPFRFVMLQYLFCKPLTQKTPLLLLKTFLENSKHWIVLFFKNTKNPIFLCKRKMIAFKCENKGIFKRKGAVLQPIFLASNPWIASIGKGQQT